MSNFILCNYCKHQHNQFIDYTREDEMCNAGEMEPKVMYDYHGKGGRRYDEPTDVCEKFERRCN